MNNKTLLENLRVIPDFPIPGILFFDVTTLFKNADCLHELENTLYEMYKDKGITKVISALDNDDCGKKGTEFLKKHFEVTRFTYLKGVKDPGEMTQESFDKMFARTMKNFKSNN